MRPRIGVTIDEHEDNKTGKAYWLKRAYIDALLHVKALPLLLPHHSLNQNPEEYLIGLDGLLVSGGDFDIDPKYFHQPNTSSVRRIVEERTQFEMSLIRHSIAQGRPILGICGGVQLLNVCLGGTLKQHIEKHENCTHTIRIEDQSLLSQLLGCKETTVNSSHHQSIDKVGKDLKTAAVSADGEIEAVELPNHPFCLGVQWHPEGLRETENDQQNLFREFVSAATEFSQKPKNH